MRQITGGYGKVILLGEHLVVHGYKAIVASLPFKTDAEVRTIIGKSCTILDQRPKVPTFVCTKSLLYRNMILRIAQKLGIKDNLEVILSGDLPVTSGGIGASAAASVAVAEALSKFCGAEISLDKLDQLAFAGECCIHGTPSGIDNTAALYGGLFLYDKVGGRSVIQTSKPLYLVIVDSGCTADTALAINGLRTKIASNRSSVCSLFKRYEQLVPIAVKALQDANWPLLGQFMLENHKILQQLDLSCELLDSMVDNAMEAGSLGAKLSGSGKGGIMIALVAGQSEQHRVQAAFEKQGFWTLPVTLDYATEDVDQEI
jgi:mevalonate kinase